LTLFRLATTSRSGCYACIDSHDLFISSLFLINKQGTLLDGTVIAVKQLSSKSKQGNREFVNEIGMISSLQHPNLVKLYGCCAEGNQLLLVYEYLENNSLARALFGNLLSLLIVFSYNLQVKQKISLMK